MATLMTGICNRISATAIAAPKTTIWMFKSPPKAPWTMAPMSSACGAKRAFEHVGSEGSGFNWQAVCEIRNAS